MRVSTLSRRFGLASALLFVGALGAGCASSADAGQTGEGEDAISDVNHTAVERQSIGNCWLYAEASWVESMNKTATGKDYDVSQSYWTYWHWYDQIKGGYSTEISTGGSQSVANDIVRKYGLMPEDKFVPEDALVEMSSRQSSALAAVNRELKDGALKERSARTDGKTVREVLDKAWGLSDEVKAQLDKVFGEDGATKLRTGARSPADTDIVSAADFDVSYTKRDRAGNVTTSNTKLDTAMREWSTISYPGSFFGGSSAATDRRNFLVRLQRAVHDRQPVIITWNVDFNAMESSDPDLMGSFNMTTLSKSGKPGHQGGHMTVLEDYEATTEAYGLLKAGVTLDPSNDEDKAKLDALLLPSTEIKFLRIKNSWGASRADRGTVKGFPGYHDLYMDYLNGPIKWCPDATSPTNENCTGTSVPLRQIALPPGY